MPCGSVLVSVVGAVEGADDVPESGAGSVLVSGADGVPLKGALISFVERVELGALCVPLLGACVVAGVAGISVEKAAGSSWSSGLLVLVSGAGVPFKGASVVAGVPSGGAVAEVSTDNVGRLGGVTSPFVKRVRGGALRASKKLESFECVAA